jgi:hypothetical protein
MKSPQKHLVRLDYYALKWLCSSLGVKTSIFGHRSQRYGIRARVYSGSAANVRNTCPSLLGARALSVKTSWAARLRRAIHVWKIKIKKTFLSDLRLKSFHNHNAPALIIMYPRARRAVIGSQNGHANLSRVSALALIGATVGQQNRSPCKDETLLPCSEFAQENAAT